MVASQPDRIIVRCPCGTKLKLPANAAGRRTKCLKCENVFLVPATEPAHIDETTTGETQQLDSIFNELATEAQNAPAKPTPTEDQPGHRRRVTRRV